MEKLVKKAGHRSWKMKGGRVVGEHTGDTMSPSVRSRVMSKIKGKNTKPELIVTAELRRRKIYFATHANELPGKPDVVFRRLKLAVFIDGDFWHGWRFPLWQHKLSPKWQEKIEKTRQRDQRIFRRLRTDGWRVMRIWEHQIESSASECVDRIIAAREECRAMVKSESRCG